MSRLRVYSEDNPNLALVDTSVHLEITEIMGKAGVRFEGWAADAKIPQDAREDQLLQAYQSSIDALKRDRGYQAQDVLRMHPDHPQKKEFRQKFLSEHTHSEDEVRFFVEGSGLFFLHINHLVYEVLCEAGDLISVPDNTPHWFDMGENPQFTVIRLFTNPEGWLAQYTQSPIAQSFPRHEGDLR